VGVPYDDSDLRRLQQERLVALVPVAENQLRGKPTQLGIEMVRRGFFMTRVMKEYETECPLLKAGAKERLNQCGNQREIELSRQIELAAASIRARRETIKRITDDAKREDVEVVLPQEIATLRRGIIEVAETLATEGVREFANCLLTSQGRLGNHAVLLRGYAARFASGIRHWLNASEPFRIQPLLPWRQDSITQQAIRTCEEVLAERKSIEDDVPSQKEESERGKAGQNENEPRTWSPIVQEWEALKSARRLITEQHERIPDADLRSILAGQYIVKPEDLSDGQIEYAALQLCRHYGRVQIIPSPAPDCLSAANESRELSAIPDAAFWEERESTFHLHDTGENMVLGATSFSRGDYWAFQRGSDSTSSAGSVDLFKSLAREDAKGLGSQRGAESWMDWLDLLRCAKDEDSGKLLYAKDSRGSCVMSERELRRLIESGETTPPED
jgi:hypothetical protein